jgi:nucleotide-binding universal stress UspA family protein
MSYQHILVAVDGSPTSDHAVAQAADLEQATGGRVRLPAAAAAAAA